jgi:D-amino-acid dehydrogenase
LRLIVVGGGIVGAACAYTASSLGAQVTLIDAGRDGQATAAGAGIICPWSDSAADPARYALACAAAREYPALVAELAERGEPDVSYRQVGALLLPGSQELAEAALRRLEERHAATPEMGAVRLLSGAEARELFPPLGPVPAAVHIAGAARVDGRRIAAALTHAAVRLGAVVRPGEAELVLGAGSGRVTGVRVDGARVDGARDGGARDGGELIEADAVVAATGAWTGSFLAPAGAGASSAVAAGAAVTPERGQIAHISLAPADTSRWPVILPGGTGHYLLSFDDSRVVAGATREPGAGFDYRVTPAGLAQVLGEALALAPGLGAGTYLETRVGFRPVAARPLLGPVPGVAGLFLATGLGATGLTMGPYSGSLVARAALGESVPVDLTPFVPGAGAGAA